MSKIRFLEDCELEIVESYDEEADKAETSSMTFAKGEVHDVDLDRIGDTTSSFQFGDGSMAYNVPNDLFTAHEPIKKKSPYQQVVETLAEDTQGDPKLLNIAANDLIQCVLAQVEKNK